MRLFGRDTAELRESLRENFELPLRNTFAPGQEARENGSANAAEGGKNPAQDPKYKAAQGRRKWIMVAIVILSFILFSGAAYKKPSLSSLWPGSKMPVQDHNLYLLIPSMGGDADVNTCRTLLGATVLTYSTPWIVDYSASQSKASSIVNFLEKYTQVDDMIIVLEDSWLQLRSEVLVQRYFDIMHKENKKSGAGGARLLAPGKGSAVEQGLIIGSSKYVREAYSFASEKGLDLAEAYTEQQKPRAPKLFRRQDETEPQAQAEGNTIRMVLDEDHNLLASLSDLHKVKPSDKSDFVRSAPPFWTVSGFTATGLPNSTWAQIELLGTDDAKHTVPASVHYGADSGNSALQESWSTLWYHDHARSLLTFASKRPEVPIAVVLDRTSGSTIERRFWNPLLPYTGTSKVGVKKFSDEQFHSWSSICGGASEAENVFGDDKGSWNE